MTISRHSIGSKLTPCFAWAARSNSRFNAEANTGHRFAILMASVGTLRPSAPVNLGVSTLSNIFIQPMVYLAALTFASVNPLGIFPCSGLRLGALRWFQAFWASSACAASARGYHFSSIASPPWRSVFSRFALVVKLGFPVLASGSNCAVKPTRHRRAAYFRR